jgi:hypothetical protein
VRPVALDEILTLTEYEKRRPELRPSFVALKQRRRTSVGPNMTLLWENRDTAWYQIQEMVRIERIVDSAAVAHEVATYNELVPARGELKGTLLIEYPDAEERDRWLRALRGLAGTFRLESPGHRPAVAILDPRQESDVRLSSVQFLTFHPEPELRTAILAGKPVEVVVEHPSYRERAAVQPETLCELRADLDAP